MHLASTAFRPSVLTTADEFGDVNAAVGRDRVYNSAVNAIEVGHDVTYNF